MLKPHSDGTNEKGLRQKSESAPNVLSPKILVYEGLIIKKYKKLSMGLFLTATLVLLVGVMTWYVGENNAIKDTALIHRSFSLSGQIIIILANPLLVLSSISFVVEKERERWKILYLFSTRLSRAILLFNACIWGIYLIVYAEPFTITVAIFVVILSLFTLIIPKLLSRKT
jgi:hypothetical protein